MDIIAQLKQALADRYAIYRRPERHLFARGDALRNADRRAAPMTFLSDFTEGNFGLRLDGSRVLYPAPVSSSYELIVVPNWLREFREKLAR
jgi:hypothetical protein